MKQILIGMMLVLTTLSTFGQTAGKVVEAGTNEPLFWIADVQGWTRFYSGGFPYEVYDF